MVAISKKVADGYDQDKYGENGPEVGLYHMLITKAEEPEEGKSSCPVTMTVMDGTVPKQEGKDVVDYYFPFSEKAAARLLHLFVITGAATQEQIKSGEDLPMELLVGRQLLAEIVHQGERTYKDADGKDKVQRAGNRVAMYGLASTTDPDPKWVAVPKNQAALDAGLGGGLDDAPMDDPSDVIDGDGDAPAGDDSGGGSPFDAE